MTEHHRNCPDKEKCNLCISGRFPCAFDDDDDEEEEEEKGREEE